MRVIGITGGVGAGKSEILKYLADTYQGEVVEADQVGRLVMEPGGEAYAPVLELLGNSIQNQDGTLNRGMIAEKVFGNRELLDRLNAVVHPAVKSHIKKLMEENRRKGTALFVVEAALLIEDHYDEICDELWYIYADEDTRIRRLTQSRGYSVEKSRKIIASQLKEEVFASRCDFKIDNSGTREETRKQIRQRMRKYEIM